MASQEYTLETFEAAVQQEKPVVIDFGAVWSVACLMYKEKLDIAYTELKDTAVCGSVDIDILPQLAERFSIITIPTTLIIFKNEIIKQYIGIQEPETIIDAVKTVLGMPTEKKN